MGRGGRGGGAARVMNEEEEEKKDLLARDRRMKMGAQIKARVARKCG